MNILIRALANALAKTSALSPAYPAREEGQHASSASPDSSLLELDALQGKTLAQVIWLSGKVPPPPLCTGLGHCGRCRIRYLSPPPAPDTHEQTLFSSEELESGWRLACHRRCQSSDSDILLEVPPPPPRAQRIAKQTSDNLVMAVDLGTTSLCWQAFDRHGTVIAEGQECNPQMGAGADVMSRLAYAALPEQSTHLAHLTRTRLKEISASLPVFPSMLALAANPAMTYITLGKDLSGLCHAPYNLTYQGNQTENLPSLPPIYIPPLPSPFIGGDISAGMACLYAEKCLDYPCLLADMGTNGEFVLALSPTESLLASVPLGPALEGIGLRHGDMAGEHTATAFHLHPTGIQARTPSGAPPRRICGTGYLSLLRLLLEAGLMDAQGQWLPPTSPLTARLRDHNDPQQRLPLSSNLFLWREDIEEILKVKAAFSLAVEQLLQHAQLTPGSLKNIFLSGALGTHASPGDLEALGFFPRGLNARLCATGNTSLRGAAQLLQDTSVRQWTQQWSSTSTLLPLTQAHDFHNTYLRHMRFTY